MMARPLQPIPQGVIDEAVLDALEEDGAFHDITTSALVRPDEWGRGVVVAKQAGVIAGLQVAATASTRTRKQFA